MIRAIVCLTQTFPLCLVIFILLCVCGVKKSFSPWHHFVNLPGFNTLYSMSYFLCKGIQFPMFSLYVVSLQFDFTQFCRSIGKVWPRYGSFYGMPSSMQKFQNLSFIKHNLPSILKYFFIMNIFRYFLICLSNKRLWPALNASQKKSQFKLASHTCVDV